MSECGIKQCRTDPFGGKEVGFSFLVENDIKHFEVQETVDFTGDEGLIMVEDDVLTKTMYVDSGLHRQW